MQYRYYVVAEDPEHKPSIHQDLVAPTGTDCIPARPIVCQNPMRHSEYNSVYYLTEAEAKLLVNDSRISEVHRDPVDLGFRPTTFTLTTATFAKPGYANTSTDKNWGLLRSISPTEPFGVNTSTVASFGFNLDGAGVDIVMMDSGIIKYHPEFAVNPDGTGGTRVVEVNWSTYGIIPGTGITSWVGDVDGHGSNCASIAAGNTQGWARAASIYSFNIIDPNLNNYTDPVSALQTLRAWHNAKPTTETGYKRPTVCNNSWGYDIQYANMTGTFWQGVMYPTTSPLSVYGQVSSDGSVPAANTSTTTFGLRVPSIEAEIASCISAGIIFTAAAGNQAMKCDVSGGTDYDNYWITNGNSKYYYHRGTTPAAADGVVCVGATSYSLPEHKISFSNSGPRVDIFAPGAGIMGAFINAAYTDSPVVDSRGQASTSSVYTMHNTVIVGDIDYVKFTTDSTGISKLYLTKYVSADNRAWFAIQEGDAWTAPQDQITAAMVAYGHFGPSSSFPVGANILGTFSPLKANTTYTMWIQQTGASLTEYVFSTNPGNTGQTLPADYSSNAGAPTAISGVGETFYLNKISGTSQSCPQVTGVVACLLQSRPWYKQWQVQQWLKENALLNTLNETYYGGAGYVQFAGLQGAVNRQVFQPFNNPYPWSITSGF